jgi:outer membrane protein assembly factor BamD (BamD/ComL family)
MKIGFILAAAIAACLLASCSHIPKSIPEDLSAKEIVQRAQEATDAYHYDAAIVYYDALKERFGTDPLYRTTAEYEIAFIAYKQKRYAEAKAGLESLLAEYSGPDAAGLPPRYSVLSKKVLERIEDKMKEKEPKAPKAEQPKAEQPKEEPQQ